MPCRLFKCDVNAAELNVPNTVMILLMQVVKNGSVSHFYQL
jgi:hypothetical protein